jgi:hypothetical protein
MTDNNATSKEGLIAKVTVKLNEDDYVKFNLDHIKRSPSLRRTLMLQRLMGPAVFILTAIVLGSFSGIPIGFWLAIFSITGIFWFAFYPKLAESESEKRIRKLLQEGDNKEMFLKRDIALTRNGITETTSRSKQSTPWGNITGVYETDEAIYAYISSIQGHIIPKRDFGSDEEKDQFLAILNEKTH